ncbi:hypothetical protein ACFO4E_10540 [Nocardiopsis mangrovi]|uniref:Uncharacterized protein n=1 Tax=Nocardiopsis mangrovi TaxID=1179818 RepID=A0ABV9DUC7_9ACTN
MIDEFRAAFQELIDASVATDPHQFPTAVHAVYNLASQVPVDERELALEALGPILAGGHTAPGITADLAVVAGAFVEMGSTPGGTGVDVMRLLRTMGQGAAVFLYAWERTGGGTPPDPDEVTAAAEERVAAELGEAAPTATMCWWTIRRYGLAAKTMLSEPAVRAAMRADSELSAELVAISNQLSNALTEFDEVRALLRMSEATSAVVLDRASRRGFRVLFDGIGDNFQLHTLLADALVGPEGRGLAGERPDPRWTASFRDADPDPDARVVRGWWNLVALDGSWVWNEGVPADIPTSEGEHLLILDEQPYPRSWSAGRRHPHVRGWLEVEAELPAEEAERWWRRTTPSSPSASAAALAPAADPIGLPAPPVAPADTPLADALSDAHRPADPEDLGSGPSATQQVFGFIDPPAERAEPAAAESPGPGTGLGIGQEAGPGTGLETGREAVDSSGGRDAFDDLDARQAPFGDLPPAAGPAPYLPEREEPEPSSPAPALETEVLDPQDPPASGAGGAGPEPRPAAEGDEAQAREAEDDDAPATPPGAALLPPLPPGVSDSSGWGPSWL